MNTLKAKKKNKDGVTVGFFISLEAYKHLSKEAKEEGRSLSNFIRHKLLPKGV